MINISRHSSIINPLDHREEIHIIGAGATGSRLFTSLVELGFTNISVYDFDKVENHNLANQVFQYSDIGHYKVDALKRWAEAKLGTESKTITYSTERLPSPGVYLSGYVFLLVDTMSARKEIYEECIEGNENILYVLETRMASSYGNISTFNPITDGDNWLSTLIGDDEAEVSACGSSISVGTTASIISNLCVWQFMDRCVDPSAADDIVNIFLKPFCLGVESWG